jgi:hypothetical protein
MKRPDRAETRTNLLIVTLLQAVIYSGLWLWNEYVATILTIIFPGMILVILIIGTIADLIEPSRIPRWYYGLMIISIVMPLVIGGVFYYLYRGRFDWLM